MKENMSALQQTQLEQHQWGLGWFILVSFRILEAITYTEIIEDAYGFMEEKDIIYTLVHFFQVWNIQIKAKQRREQGIPEALHLGKIGILTLIDPDIHRLCQVQQHQHVSNVLSSNMCNAMFYIISSADIAFTSIVSVCVTSAATWFVFQAVIYKKKTYFKIFIK